ncbi:glycoside hydrolase family 25 protein [Chelativorans sp. YIM 93263]|uniref:glycoside hydrolase family 25 protein n=1 Tax=Chelativorans sp. YIM 93263 TaxID=2906648 RepID=UPI0023794A28|nr:GH25 family lysozyme [Chelativorans sp. YIM 93263]
MRLTVILCVLILFAGCTSISYDFSDVAPSSSSPPPGLRYADSKPHAWDGRTPAHYAVHGTDVAKYQGKVNWQHLRQAGIAFAFIKATEGGDRVDDMFHRNWREAKAAGIPRGAYHFFYFCRPAIEQARWFIEHVPRDRSALPPVLDMEWNHLSPTCRKRPAPEIVRAEMRIFLNAVERHYGKRPIIYTSIDFFDRNDLRRFTGYEFWLRSVAGHPDVKYGNHPWTFWQYTGTGILPGVEGNVDINVFKGGTKAWREWLKARTG